MAVTFLRGRGACAVPVHGLEKTARTDENGRALKSLGLERVTRPCVNRGGYARSVRAFTLGGSAIGEGPLPHGGCAAICLWITRTWRSTMPSQYGRQRLPDDRERRRPAIPIPGNGCR